MVKYHVDFNSNQFVICVGCAFITITIISMLLCNVTNYYENYCIRSVDEMKWKF